MTPPTPPCRYVRMSAGDEFWAWSLNHQLSMVVKSENNHGMTTLVNNLMSFYRHPLSQAKKINKHAK